MHIHMFKRLYNCMQLNHIELYRKFSRFNHLKFSN
nr:MAG TPA: hypothetical protein [Caudoviricetes sp.]